MIACIRERLLQETNLKFDEAMKLPHAMETADKNECRLPSASAQKREDVRRVV